MSGIAGIVLPAGRSVDERLLRRMAAPMARRAPEGDHTWTGGNVGFAHALLRAGDARHSQPTSFDGYVWITADARIDGRAALVASLEGAGRSDVSRSDDDARLILHAYHAWGEHCVDRLIGDFAFAIWDSRSQRLFCARDQFGIKPFYYAAVDGGFVFSNTLDCVRQHPEVEDELDELWVADFLLFGFSRDTSTTAFRQIHRLPPAHTLSGTAAGWRSRRYWTLPTEGRIRYTHARDYVDHLAELLRDAVADRIGSSRTAIWMSGGLDSAAIAVTARRVVEARGARFDARAHTVVYDSLIEDDERRYAALAAAAAGIEPHYWAAADALPFEGWQRSAFRTPEPIDDPYYALHVQRMHAVAADSRIALAGDGGDEVLWRSCVADLAGKMPLHELALDLARCVVHGRRPAAGLRAKVSRRQPGANLALPGWLNPDFAERLQLRERMRDGSAGEEPGAHALRNDAYRRLSSSAWPAFLESVDPGFSGVPLEHRWPFLDLRLVNFLLGVPPLPWCVDKHLLRLAMRGMLPDAVVRRKKSSLSNDPLRAHLQRGDWSWLDRFAPAPRLAHFVDCAAIPPVASMAAAENPWLDLRPFCLNYWLSRADGHAA